MNDSIFDHDGRRVIYDLPPQNPNHLKFEHKLIPLLDVITLPGGHLGVTKWLYTQDGWKEFSNCEEALKCSVTRDASRFPYSYLPEYFKYGLAK